MQSSIVQRERLVSPLHLLLMALLFAVAFAVLKPQRAPGEALLATPELGAAAADTLQLAYLKAIALNDRQGMGGDDLPRVARSLLRAGRLQEVKGLLQSFPNLRLSESLRFELDLEFAARESTHELPDLLRALLNTPKAHSDGLLGRAIDLSKQLKQPELSQALYQARGQHALQGDAESGALTGHSTAAQVYLDCGDYLRSTGHRQLAVQCYWDVLDANPDSIAQFNAQLALLTLSTVGGEAHHRLTSRLVSDLPSSVDQLERLASALLSVERPDLAHGVYAKLAEVDSDGAVRWLDEASRWANASGKPGQAAQYLLHSVDRANESQRQALRQRAATLMIQAGRFEYAMEQLDQMITEQPENATLLGQGVALARQLGETQKALMWNSRLLDMDADNVSLMADQIELALMAADLSEAYRWARIAVAQSPEDSDARHQLAQISEWAGYPDQALDQWLWLGNAEYANKEQAREAAMLNVVRLAKMTLQPAAGAQALSALARWRKPTDAEVAQLVDFFKLEGQPDAAVEALRDIGRRHGTWPFLLLSEAELAYLHNEYDKALMVWRTHDALFGDSVEALLMQTELLWRLDQQQEAVSVASKLEGRTLASQASSYQLSVLAEIAWRYRLPWLALLVQPRLSEIEADGQRRVYESRLLAALQDAGDDDAAIRESVKLWGNTGQRDFALQAMALAVKVDNKQVQARFTPETLGTDSALHADPDYWMLVASIKLRDADRQAARRSYEQVLKLEPDHIEAIRSLLWLAIGDEDRVALNEALDRHAALAQETTELWQPMAVGFYQLGQAKTSLIWFDKALEQIEADYGMLLTYADALEATGRVADALAVRQYALQRLRPLLLDGTVDEQSLLLRQYARLSLRYGDTDDNERLVNYLLNQSHALNDRDLDADDALWREDIAISWLMATQQFEPAKVIMAQMHARRLQTPSWQRLALALQDRDTAAVQAAIQASGNLSIGDQILALRRLGRSSDAFAMAREALNTDMREEDRLTVQAHYTALRADHPGFFASSFSSQRTGRLDVRDRDVSVRYSLPGRALGLGLYARQRQFEGRGLPAQIDDSQEAFRLSLFYANGQRRAALHAGVGTSDAGEQVFGGARFAQRLLDGQAEISAELAYAEEANNSAELLLAGSQHRASLAFTRQFARGEYINLRADVTQINTRIEQNKLALGFGSSVEVGLQSTMGVHNWSTGLRAAQVSRDRVSRLPDELALFQDSGLDSVIGEDEQSLSLGVSLSRGKPQADFPLARSPRYYINTRLGKSWPSGRVGLEMGAGAGIRVLGGDELSFSLLHDTKPVRRSSGDATSVGIHYRYHFQ